MKLNVLALLAVASVNAFAADLPNLKVVPCGTCSVDEGTLSAIVRGYKEALGDSAVYSGEATVQIDRIEQRSTGARVFLGVLSGKDVIEATVQANGHIFQVQDTARSSMCGIECVGGNIGREIAMKLDPARVKAVRQENNPSAI